VYFGCRNGRFAYFGFRAILVLFFVQALEYDENEAIANYAYTTCLAYFSPLLGALLADGQFGRFKTILYCGILYIVGLAVLTFAAWGDWEDLGWKRFMTVLGLVLVCLGTGGIKPCVSAFGADQVALQKTTTSKSSSHDDRAIHGSIPAMEAMTKEESAAVNLPESTMDDENEASQRVRAFFAYFYFCINVGAVLSIALVPIVRGFAGFGPAFSLSLWFMIIAITLFASKQTQYHHVVPGEDGTTLSMTLRLCWWLMRQNLWRQHPFIRRFFPLLEPGPCPTKANATTHLRHQEHGGMGPMEHDTSGLDGERGRIDERDPVLEEQLSDASQVLHVLPIFCALPIFWCLYDQQGSVWTLQANRMALHGLQPEQLNVVNPIEIMLFLPLFEKLIYPFLEREQWDISPLTRMQWGMLLSAISFVMSGLVESWIEYNNDHGVDKVSVFWQLPQITILAVGEIFVSVTGLEFAYACAPTRVKALIMSLFLLTTAVGNMFSGALYSTVFAHMDRSTIMHVCALLMMCNLTVFYFLAKWWKQTDAMDLRRSLFPQSTNEIEMETTRRD